MPHNWLYAVSGERCMEREFLHAQHAYDSDERTDDRDRVWADEEDTGEEEEDTVKEPEDDDDEVE